jgi:transposase
LAAALSERRPPFGRFKLEHHGPIVAHLLAHIDTLDQAIQGLDEKIETILTPHARSSSCCSRSPGSRCAARRC